MANFSSKWSSLSKEQQQAMKDKFGSKQGWQDAKAKSQGYDNEAAKKAGKSSGFQTGVADSGAGVNQSGQTSSSADMGTGGNSGGSGRGTNPNPSDVSKRYYQKWSDLTEAQRAKETSKSAFKKRKAELGLKGINVKADTKTRMAGDALRKLNKQENPNEAAVRRASEKVYGVDNIDDFDGGAAGAGSKRDYDRLSKADIKGLRKQGFSQQEILDYAERTTADTSGKKAQKMLQRFRDNIAAQNPVEPSPEPGPSPTPQPGPSPTPQPGPSPNPEPTPQPGPTPTPQPGPSPTPQPTPQPGPTPTPQPDPGDDIYDGPGDDIYGGPGDDQIETIVDGPGDDIYGGPGDDTITRDSLNTKNKIDFEGGDNIQKVKTDNTIKDITIKGDGNYTFFDQSNRVYGGDNRRFNYFSQSGASTGGSGGGSSKYEERPVGMATLAGYFDRDDSPAAQAGFVDMYSSINRDNQKRYAGSGLAVANMFNNFDARSYKLTGEGSMNEVIGNDIVNTRKRADQQTAITFGDIWRPDYAPDWKNPDPPKSIDNNVDELTDEAKDDIEDV